MKTPRPRYFLAVDGLRLLASVNIVLFHLEGIGGLHNLGGAPAWLFRIVKGPAFHASIFFLLGGFIYATKFGSEAGNFRTVPFIRKRLKELYPLHAITTCAMVVMVLLHQLHAGHLDLPRLAFSAFMHLSLLWSFFPFSSYGLNRPSWALSAFFLCYLLFGPVLGRISRIGSRAVIVVLMGACLGVSMLWGLLYGAIGMPETAYQFFHAFGGVRLFEFIMGMLLARLFALRDTSKLDARPVWTALRCDTVIAASAVLVYLNLYLDSASRPLLGWLSYHVFMVPIYGVLLYHLAIERGVFAGILSLKTVRQIGTSSFYPYLIHIPLISLITYVCERYLDYERFLHSPVNITVFIVLLYGASAVYVARFRKRGKAPARRDAPVESELAEPARVSAASTTS